MENPDHGELEQSSKPKRNSSFRSRNGQRTSVSPGISSSEPIGEIQFTPGEVLKDDLTANSDAAKSKGESHAPPTSDKADRKRKTEKAEAGARSGKERQERGRARQGNKRSNEERSAEQTRSRQHRRKGKGGRKRSRSKGRPEKTSDVKQQDTKPVTWDAGEMPKEPGLLGRAGKFFSSILGLSKEDSPSSTQQNDGKKSHPHERRRRRRRRRRSRRNPRSQS